MGEAGPSSRCLRSNCCCSGNRNVGNGLALLIEGRADKHVGPTAADLVLSQRRGFVDCSNAGILDVAPVQWPGDALDDVGAPQA
jgi:hypothetical protein